MMIGLAALVLLLVAAPASAHPIGRCMPYALLIKHLETKYGEVPTGRGLSGPAVNTRIVELLVSPDGSFTVVAVLPSLLACPLATGRHWRALAAPDDGT